jgi:hypothetical protein
MTIHPLSKTVKITHVFTGRFTQEELDRAKEQNKEQNRIDVSTRTEQKFQLS